MKQVIVGHTDTIDIYQCSENKFYGVLFVGDDENKHFITKNNFYNGEFQIKATYNLTVGSSFPVFSNKILHIVLKNIVDRKHKVYQFDTHKELFKWLAK